MPPADLDLDRLSHAELKDLVLKLLGEVVELPPLWEAAPFTTKLEKLPKARVNGSAYTGYARAIIGFFRSSARFLGVSWVFP